MLSLLLTCSVLYAATWNPLTAADFSTALSNSQPGDTIRLCNGKAYVESTGKGFQVTKALTITNLKDSSACNNDNLPIITTAKFVTINKVSSSNTKGMVAQPQYSSTVVSAPSGVSNAYAHGLWTAWGLRYVQARFPNMELSNNVYEYFPKWSEVCIMKFNGFAYGRPWSTDHKKDPSNNLNVLPGPDAIASSCEYVSCRSNGDKISVLNDAKITDYYLITRNTHYSTTIYPIDRLDGTNFKFKGKSIPVYGNTNKWGLIADAQYSFPEDGKDSSQRCNFQYNI